MDGVCIGFTSHSHGWDVTVLSWSTNDFRKFVIHTRYWRRDEIKSLVDLRFSPHIKIIGSGGVRVSKSAAPYVRFLCDIVCWWQPWLQLYPDSAGEPGLEGAGGDAEQEQQQQQQQQQQQPAQQHHQGHRQLWGQEASWHQVLHQNTYWITDILN